MTAPRRVLRESIRVERDPRFWTTIANDPAVRAALGETPPETIGALAALPGVLPLAARRGGFLFVMLSAGVLEMHSLFAPEGWGREAAGAGAAALGFVFHQGAALVTTYEVEGRPRSKPPHRAGFAPQGDWRAGPTGRLRLWILTKSAWEASPYGRPDTCQPPSSEG